MGRLTYVILASEEPIDPEEWDPAIDEAYGSTVRETTIGPGSLIGQYFSEDEKKEILTSRRSITLTDDYAPVDNLIAPVFDDVH